MGGNAGRSAPDSLEQSMKQMLLVLFLAACGGGQIPTSGETPLGDCPYSAEDSCMNEDALAQCEARAAECPGNVTVMESCPLQFACAGGAAECTEGETRPADDGCNTCQCNEGGWSCTEMGCEEAAECTEGETRPSEDGCNTCQCNEGLWSCTEMACAEEAAAE